MSGLDPADHVRLAWHEANRFRNVDDFESLVCEALLALVRAADAFNPALGFKPASYLGPVIRGACLTEWKRQKRLRREIALYVVTEEGEEHERPDLPTVEPVAEQRVLEREVREAVERLPDRERHIVGRRYGLVDGQPASAGEVAASLGMKEKAAEYLRRKGEKRLREALTREVHRPGYAPT